MNTGIRDLKKVKELGRTFVKKINSVYKELEIDIDGIFTAMLLLKKKKYAALVAVESGRNGEYTTQRYFSNLSEVQLLILRSTKGIDLVRRDWSVLSAEVGSRILDFLLVENKAREDVLEEIHGYLRDVVCIL